MAGIPPEVITRAREGLRTLEKGSVGVTKDIVNSSQEAPKKQKMQLTLFEAEKHPILEELETLDVSSMTPVEALMKLDAWKRRI